MTGWHPVADQAAATTLGETLRDLGYSETAVEDLLGEEAYSRDRDDAPVAERRLPPSRLGTVVRALFLQLPVSARDATRALGRGGVEALEATGLAEVGDDVVPRVRIVPVGQLLVASDDFPEEDGEEAADYVAAYTPTSRLVDSLTPRRRVARALDVGCGSGVHALLAARHAEEVVATDVNTRALAYTELNAALNGLTNVECRPGSVFEPVHGERFDLITSNAPYVVSPEQRLAYRDGGFEADELSERIVQGAADHLTEGGYATLLVSWIARDEDAPDERALAWTEAIGCDSWILPIWGSDPLDHAATWNEHLAGDGNTFGAALDDWTDYLERLGARWVTEGAILLHRRAGRVHTTRVDEVDEDLLDEASGQIQRAFAARAQLSGLTKATDLLDARLSLASTAQLEHELRPARRRTVVSAARLHLDEGTHPVVEATPRALEIVAALDGGARLADVVQAAAQRLKLSESETARLRREALAVRSEERRVGKECRSRWSPYH